MILQLTGGIKNRIASNATRQGVLGYCAQSPVPIGLDDPSSIKEVENLCIDLYNGSLKLTVGQGSQKPRTTMVVASNFPIENNHRCVHVIGILHSNIACVNIYVDFILTFL